MSTSNSSSPGLHLCCGLDRREPAGRTNSTTSTTLIKVLAEIHDIDSGADALTVAIAADPRDIADHEQSKQVSGRKRNYFAEEGQQSELVTLHNILDTGLHLKTGFLPDTIVRIIERVL